MERLAVFYGGKSCEHEVSIITALSIIAEIESDYEIIPVYMCEKGFFTGELLKNIDSYKSFDENMHVKIILDGNSLKTRGFLGFMKEYDRFDVALICAHGGMGEGGGLSGLLEINNVPYTCCDVLSSSVCLDKEYFKIIAKHKGFKVVSGTCITKNDVKSPKTLERIIKKYGELLVVKPVDCGSSVGVKAINGLDELKKSVDVAFAYSDRVIIEKRITQMVEYNCAAICVGGEIIVSAIEKPRAHGDILSYKDKYLQKEKIKPEYKPESLSYTLSNKIRKTTYKLYEEFNLSGVVRVDYIYNEKDNELYVNEVNTVPGSLSTGLFKECGIETKVLVDALIEDARRKFEKKNNLITHYSSELLSGEYKVNKN